MKDPFLTSVYFESLTPMLFSKNILYIASRYLLSKHQNPSIKIMVRVCAAGILIATCALALIFSIMTGFEKATYQKMQSIYPDIIIDGDGQIFDQNEIDIFFKHHTQHIAAHAPQAIHQALVSDEDGDIAPSMIMLRGISSEQENCVSNISSKIIDPAGGSLIELLYDDQVIIGSKLAQDLNVSVGDTISILHSNGKAKSLLIQFQQHMVTIGGIFQTGMEDFDANLVLCDIPLVHKLFPDDGINFIHLKLQDLKFEQVVQKELEQELNACIYSWKDLYKPLLSALKLEKWAMFFILILIICVASMNIISLIFMYVTQKQRDIIILLCMGMTKANIRAIFTSISLCIALPAASTGLSLAWGIGLLLQKYPFIQLPDDIYDTQYLPIQLEAPVFFAILIITILISLLASLYATRSIHRIQIVELLKMF